MPAAVMVVRCEIRQLATGRLVWTRSFGRLGAAPFTVDLVPEDLLPSGAYVVRLFLDEEVHDRKLILVR